VGVDVSSFFLLSPNLSLSLTPLTHSLNKYSYVLTCGECDVVCVTSDSEKKTKSKMCRKEGWILKRRSGWYNVRNLKRFLRIEKGVVMYTSRDPASPSFDPSKDWKSQPISSRHVVTQPSTNSIQIEDPCDANLNMILTATNVKEAKEWKDAIESEIHDQVTAFDNTVRVSRLYPGDLIGRPLNLCGKVQKSNVSVFTRIQRPGLGNLNVYKKSVLNTRDGSEGPPCFYRSSISTDSSSFNPYVNFLLLLSRNAIFKHTHTHTVLHFDFNAFESIEIYLLNTFHL